MMKWILGIVVLLASLAVFFYSLLKDELSYKRAIKKLKQLEEEDRLSRERLKKTTDEMKTKMQQLKIAIEKRKGK